MSKDIAIANLVSQVFIEFAKGGFFVEVTTPPEAGLITSDNLQQALRKAGKKPMADKTFDASAAVVELAGYEPHKGSRLIVTEVYRSWYNNPPRPVAPYYPDEDFC